jgi:copper homeostasis protein
MSYELEIIGFDIASCSIAQAMGASRIELCANPEEGGTTPSFGIIEQAIKTCSIPVFPIIRPRGGDFLYTKEEFEAMKTDIKNCLSIGCDGVVVGMLMGDGQIDVDRTSELVAVAGNMEVTFHRAFDRVVDPQKSLEKIISIGCKRILTSGLHKSALEGKLILKELVEQAAGRIEIMLGSGVRANNVVELAVATGARAFHSSARMQVASKMLFNNPNMSEELKHASLDADEVKKLKEQLDQYFNPEP